MACVSKVLIVGGGIAGLSAAIALSRNGVACDVLEIGEDPAGASLSLSGRAIDALEELGVYQECYDTGAPFTPQMSSPMMLDAAGNPLGAPAVRPPIANAKTPIGVFRPTFARVLEAAALKAGAKVEKGLTVEKIENGANSVSVVLSTGEHRTYDFVIGADGIMSKVRTLLFPEAAAPEYSGQMSVRWMIPGPAIDGEAWYVGRSGRLGFFHMPKQNLVYAPIVFTMPDIKLSQEEAYSRVKEFLSDFTAPAVINLRNYLKPDSTFICRAFRFHLVGSPWYRGRTLLIGDAAHATTAHMGMGAGMALEDSVVLGQCIAGADTLAAALSTFMERRFERVRTVAETSLTLSKMEQSGAPNSEYMAILGAAYAKISKPY